MRQIPGVRRLHWQRGQLLLHVEVGWIPDVVCDSIRGHDYCSLSRVIIWRKTETRSRLGCSMFSGGSFGCGTGWQHEPDRTFLLAQGGQVMDY